MPATSRLLDGYRNSGSLSNGSSCTDSEGKSKYSLEDIIYEMSTRDPTPEGGSSSVNGSNDDEDVYTQLADKERDLILAAELGKALLEKNEELSRENERIAEDFSQQLELLEQEKHLLRRKLDNTSAEYDLRIQELENEIASTREEVRAAQNRLKAVEKEKGKTIAELTEQNQRLTTQLKETARTEGHLNAELQSLRDQVSMKRSTLTTQVSQVELLRAEIEMLTSRRSDLERRVQSLSHEREDLSMTLDESSDRILHLEREGREKEVLLRHNERELLDLRMANAHLVERLEHLSRQASSHAQSLNSSSSPEVSGHIGNNSLLDEIGHQGSPFSSDRKRRTMSPDEVLDDIEEDIECEDSDGHIRLGFTSSEIKELKQEILDVYHMCRAMIDQIRHQRRNSLSSLETLSSDEVDVSQVKVGLLREVMKELKSLFHDLIRRENQLSLSSASSSESPSQVALELEVQLHRSKEACEQLERQFEKLSKERDAQQKENDSLQGQLTVTEARLAACEEQRDTYKQDLENTHLSKDVLVKKAWEVRDKAVQRKNTAEIELARTRVEVMQINSQLMEAVQQKVELKIKLDQWEADMERLLEEKVKKKLVSSSSKTNYRPSKNQNSSGGESDSSPPRKRTSRFMSYFTRQSPSS